MVHESVHAATGSRSTRSSGALLTTYTSKSVGALAGLDPDWTSHVDTGIPDTLIVVTQSEHMCTVTCVLCVMCFFPGHVHIDNSIQQIAIVKMTFATYAHMVAPPVQPSQAENIDLELR